MDSRIGSNMDKSGALHDDSSENRFMFLFERNFDPDAARGFLGRNSPMMPCLSVTVYVIVIFAIKAYMEKHPRFEVRMPLVIWSLSLAVFSIAGALRTAQYLVPQFFKGGAYHILCGSHSYRDPVGGYWSFLFVMSKYVELGDTIFIVLRKQPLIFLHWYHHVTVLLYTSFVYVEFPGTGSVFGLMNYAVHSVMYSYYALRAMRVRMPNFFALSITVMQLSQMAVGVAVNVAAVSMKYSGRPCALSDWNVKATLAMYLSYFVLFANFLYRTYFKKGGKRSMVSKEATSSATSQVSSVEKKEL